MAECGALSSRQIVDISELDWPAHRQATLLPLGRTSCHGFMFVDGHSIARNCLTRLSGRTLTPPVLPTDQLPSHHVSALQPPSSLSQQTP